MAAGHAAGDADRHSARSSFLLPPAILLWREVGGAVDRYSDKEATRLESVAARRNAVSGAPAVRCDLHRAARLEGVHRPIRPASYAVLTGSTVLGNGRV